MNSNKINTKRMFLTISVLVLLIMVMVITMFKPKYITVVLDDDKIHLTTNKFYTKSLIKDLENEYNIKNKDKVYKSDSGDKLKNDAIIIINTKKVFDLKLDNNNYKQYKTYTSNLRELLDEINQKENTVDNKKGKYVSLAYLNKEKDVKVSGLDKLDLVLYKVVKSKDEIIDKHGIKTISSDKLAEGKQKVKVEGKDGKYLDEVTKVYINGKLVDTKSKRIKTLVNKQTKVIEKGIVKNNNIKVNKHNKSKKSAGLYSLAQFMQKGVVNWGGYKFTYYSQSVLPGGGLKIPGRHVSAAGYVCDKDGYIVLASSAPKGTVFATPFGASGKVYDRGVSGNHLDVYIK